jgi:aryl-alcohol dehydrogenase-like predicted oxidoreductase
MQRQGKIRYIGVSNFDARQIKRAVAVAPITSIQPPYSLLARDVESSALPFANDNHIGVIVYSQMYSGLLSGAMTSERIAHLPEDDWRKGDPNFQEPLLSRNLRLVETLRSIGHRYNTSPGGVAIAWTLRNPAVTAAIVGVRNAKQVRGVVGAAWLNLSAADATDIEGSLRAAAA